MLRDMMITIPTNQDTELYMKKGQLDTNSISVDRFQTAS